MDSVSSDSADVEWRDIIPKLKKCGHRGETGEDDQSYDPAVPREHTGSQRQHVNQQGYRIPYHQQGIRQFGQKPLAEGTFEQQQPKIEPDQATDVAPGPFFGRI